MLLKIWNYIRKKRILRRTLLLSLLLLFWIILVLPLYRVYRDEGDLGEKPQRYGTFQGDFIQVNITVNEFEPTTKSVTVRYTFMPMGKYAGEENTLTTPIYASFLHTAQTFQENSIMNSQELTISAVQGNVRDYPFDRYLAYIPIRLREEDRSGPVVPVGIFYTDPIKGFLTRSDFDYNTKDFNRQGVELRTRRTNTVISFSVFIMILFWAVSLTLFAIFIQVVIKGRDPTFLISIGFTLMFAFPALRNSQPDAPPIGCVSDVLAFFWAMGINAVSASGILMYFVMTWKKPKEEENKEKDDDKKEEMKDEKSTEDETSSLNKTENK